MVLKSLRFTICLRRVTIAVLPRIDSLLTAFEGMRLAILLGSILREGMKVVEVGAYSGGTTAAIAVTINKYGQVFAVDIWDDDVSYQKFLFVDKMLSNVTPLKMTSKEASTHFKDGSLDMVFIDADHRYEFVKEDIELWMPKIRGGGIICGHDCEYKYTEWDTKSKELLEKHKYNDDTPFDAHAGVIMALHDVFNDEYELSLGSTVWWKYV